MKPHFVWLLVVCLAPTVLFAQDRPNIVWIVTEDNSKHQLRLYDPAGAPMPTIERLAKTGIVFNHVFSHSPVCSVSRSTIITGAYGPRIGTQYHRRSEAAPLPEGLRMFPFYLREAGYYTTNNAKTDYNVRDAGMWDESSNQATWRNRKPGQPFFHVQNFETTHESRLQFPATDVTSKPNDTPSSAVKLLPYHPDTPLMRYTYAREQDQHKLVDRQIGEFLEKLAADGLLENTILFYYGDHGGVLPRSKGYIYESGLHVPFVLHVPEKWRALVPFAPGTRVDGFIGFVDLAPTVLNLAGVKAPAAMDGRAFLGAGVTAASVNARDEAYAYADRFDEKYDLVRAVRKGKFKYLRHYQPFNPDALHNNYRYQQPAYAEWRDLYRAGKLNAVQRQFFEPRTPEALYDLERDPHETVNLAADPAHASTLADLRGRLAAWVKGLPDLSFYPEPVLLKEGLANPVAFGRSRQAEIARLVDTADLSLLPFASARPRLEAALASTNPWERYWALIACSSHGAAARPLVASAQRLAANDPEALVRVRAAEFLALIGAQEPQPVITAALRASTDPIEANLILNTVVLLRDRQPGNAFTIDPAWFPAAWRADANLQLHRRIEYLTGVRVEAPAGGKKKKKAE
jgi:arylsulfatase A-like enzyme